ncbi:MAG: 3-hydroxyacyl-CoA dehydrogenase family protein [Bacillota bacterium]|jgi:3-hydroxybutyryl-CoA dehydrogenase|nr:3-hydroxyacyl-CoA dehydrogenase family protein [Bacillota bacterium]
MKNEIKRIAVLGAGTMGAGIGQLFAMKGFQVMLIYTCEADQKSDPPGRIRSSLEILKENQVITAEEIPEIMKRISITESLEEAAGFADIIFECIIEDLKIKQDYFAELDRLCPKDTILASNTSAISITEIAEKAEQKERIIGTHYWNPAYLIPLVEVVKTKYVSEQTVNRTCALLTDAGKKPVVVNKDVPGFLANRMQHALFREALYIIEQGIAEPEAVDDAIKYGFGMRLGIMAPVTVMDMGGLDLTHSIHSYLFRDLNCSKEPSPMLIEKLNQGKLGFKTGEGLLPWTQEKIEFEKKNLTEKLIKIARILERL